MQPVNPMSFQFHKGTIRTTHEVQKFVAFTYFNSIKVRLEHLMVVSLMLILIFQFHKGTIRTIGLLRNRFLLINFNSIKVRLEL